MKNLDRFDRARAACDAARTLTDQATADAVYARLLDQRIKRMTGNPASCRGR